jgi:hypothetical protein
MDHKHLLLRSKDVQWYLHHLPTKGAFWSQ